MPYEVDFLPVGESNGDAICLRYGSPSVGYTVHVVDGGYSDTGQLIIDHLNSYYGRDVHIDHVVLSHADLDHASGLRVIMENCDVGMLWMNRPWLYAEEVVHNFHMNFTVQGLRQRLRDAYPVLVELEEIAERRGIPIREAFSGQRIGQFTVLAPSRARYLTLIPQFTHTPDPRASALTSAMRTAQALFAEAKSWFFETWTDEKLSDNPPATTAANESSIVQLATIDGHRMLLTADAGPEALAEAADVAEQLGMGGLVRFMQIPHHGSRRNVTPTVLNRWLGGPVQEGQAFYGTAFCSVGTNQPQYPRHRVRNAFLRRGYGVYSCRDGWICHNEGANRLNMAPIQSEQFSTRYEE